jgi:hypothetical protein
MAKHGQGAIEFFLIAGFILLATSVLLSQADAQMTGTATLSNVLVARSALDLETSSLKYVYLSGNYSKITQKVFIPVGAQCYFPDASQNRLYCIVPGAKKTVVGEIYDHDDPTVNQSCFRSGWLTVATSNVNGLLTISCS